jgi:hypothetical protein
VSILGFQKLSFATLSFQIVASGAEVESFPTNSNTGSNSPPTLTALSVLA